MSCFFGPLCAQRGLASGCSLRCSRPISGLPGLEVDA